jgi:anthranilate phosphoribosyltransferase
VQLAGWLASAATRGESESEIAGAVDALRAAMLPFEHEADDAIDTCGTGGDGVGSFNLSTAAAIVAAAAGCRVIKHGNRALSSRCGSADLLEAAGVPLDLSPAAAREVLERTGITFLFAPLYHPALKAAAPVRKALGVRTIFNLLGPLANPAEAPFALIGAWSLEIAQLMADTLAGMAITRAFVVYGDSGWDEPTPAAAFTLFDVRPGSVTVSRRSASDFGLPACDEQELIGGDAAHNARRLAAVLRGTECGGHRNALVMGAALVLELTALVPGPLDGALLAARAIDDGRAARLLDSLVAPARERSA